MSVFFLVQQDFLDLKSLIKAKRECFEIGPTCYLIAITIHQKASNSTGSNSMDLNITGFWIESNTLMCHMITPVNGQNSKNYFLGLHGQI